VIFIHHNLIFFIIVNVVEFHENIFVWPFFFPP